MNIVLALPQARGGIGFHVRNLQKAYLKAGHKASVFTVESTQEYFRFPDAHLLTDLGMISKNQDKSCVNMTRYLLNQAQVVHVHGWRAAMWLWLWQRRGWLSEDCACFVSIHNQLSIGSRSSWLVLPVLKSVLRSSAAVSGASADLVEVARELGAKCVFLEQVPSGLTDSLLKIPPMRAQERQKQKERILKHLDLDASLPMVLTVARWSEQKDLTTLARVYAQLKYEVNWVVIGTGDNEIAQEALRLAGDRKQVNENPKGQLLFVGASTQIEQYLAGADIFVLTSRWEARALVVQEALAAGLPVVATDTGGLSDLILPLLENKAAFLAPVGDDIVIKTMVETALELRDWDTQEGEERVAQRRQLAANWLTLEQVAHDWLERYKTRSSAV